MNGVIDHNRTHIGMPRVLTRALPTSDYGVPPQCTPTPCRLSLTGAESFWYILQCIDFGAGYLAKVPMKKDLSEVPVLPAAR